MRSLGATAEMTEQRVPLAPATMPTHPPRSPWHSPVPYLFGGLAAMLGLIAFALLLLACSYWKLSGGLEGDGNGGREGDVEPGESQKQRGCSGDAMSRVYEEKILVIMAGEEKPTFLATPVDSKWSGSGSGNEKAEKNDGEKVETPEEKKEETVHDHDGDAGDCDHQTQVESR